MNTFHTCPECARVTTTLRQRALCSFCEQVLTDARAADKIYPANSPFWDSNTGQEYLRVLKVQA